MGVRCRMHMSTKGNATKVLVEANCSPELISLDIYHKRSKRE